MSYVTVTQELREKIRDDRALDSYLVVVNRTLGAFHRFLLENNFKGEFPSYRIGEPKVPEAGS